MVEQARTGSALASRWQSSGRILGVDLSPRNTGLVVIDEMGIFMRSQTLRYALTREKKSDPPITESQRIERMLSIANDVIGICKLWKIKFIGIEGYAMDARFQAHQIGEVAGTLKTQIYLALRRIPYIVPPQTARKHVTGYGRPDKKQIFEIVSEGLAWPVKTEHEADAGIVARYLFDRIVAEEKELTV